MGGETATADTRRLDVRSAHSTRRYQQKRTHQHQYVQHVRISLHSVFLFTPSTQAQSLTLPMYEESRRQFPSRHKEKALHETRQTRRTARLTRKHKPSHRKKTPHNHARADSSTAFSSGQWRCLPNTPPLPPPGLPHPNPLSTVHSRPPTWPPALPAPRATAGSPPALPVQSRPAAPATAAAPSGSASTGPS